MTAVKRALNKRKIFSCEEKIKTSMAKEQSDMKQVIISQL